MIGRRVLIAHAAGVMRMIVKNALLSNGFEVVGEASSGTQVVEKYRALLPTIVTMDMVLPELDGARAVKAIIAEHPEALIIMCAGTDQPTLVVEALQAGAKTFVTKPFGPSVLIEAILKVLSKQAA